MAVGITVALVVGLMNAAATIYAGKAEHDARFFFRSVASKGLFFLQVSLGLACIAFLVAGHTQYALLCISINGAIYAIQFLSAPGAATRPEIFQLVLYVAGIGWFSLVSLLTRIVDAIQLGYKP